MNPSSFYGSSLAEESSDEDFIPSNESDSSSSEYSDEEEGDTLDGEDETEETDDSSPNSNLATTQGWGPVSSKQRSYAFSGKEQA